MRFLASKIKREIRLGYYRFHTSRTNSETEVIISHGCSRVCCQVISVPCRWRKNFLLLSPGAFLLLGRPIAFASLNNIQTILCYELYEYFESWHIVLSNTFRNRLMNFTSARSSCVTLTQVEFFLCQRGWKDLALLERSLEQRPLCPSACPTWEILPAVKAPPNVPPCIVNVQNYWRNLSASCVLQLIDRFLQRFLGVSGEEWHQGFRGDTKYRGCQKAPPPGHRKI